MKYFLIISLFGLLSCSAGHEINAWVDYQAGVKDLKDNKGEQGLNQFAKSLDDIPQKARTLAHMGLAFQLLQVPDKAENTYLSSLRIKSSDSDAYFMAHFNLGTLYALQKKTDAALDAYQAALMIRPDSMEAKTNIEMLIQQQQQDQENKDKKDQDKKDQDKKDQKDPNGDQGKDPKDQKDPKDPKNDKDKDKEQKPEPKEYKQDQKYKPRDFKGEMHPQDVQKILGELKQQEQKIRMEYNKKGIKEEPRDKDW